jgi:hypothetical protein
MDLAIDMVLHRFNARIRDELTRMRPAEVQAPVTSAMAG